MRFCFSVFMWEELFFVVVAAVNSESPKEKPPPTPTSTPTPAPAPTPESTSKENSMGSIQEDAKEGEVEDEEGLTIYPYERLKTTSTEPVTDIDVTKREVLLLFFSSMLVQLSAPDISSPPPPKKKNREKGE